MNIRKADPADARELSEILNEIIAIGGTTAIETPLSPEELADWFITGEWPLTCHVAESSSGLAGFQSLSLYGNPPKGWADIATFARQNPKIPGAGTALFAATLAVAKERNIEFINATIRADNTGGLAYYEKMGFRTYNTIEKVPLKDGTLMDRIQKRYEVQKDWSGLQSPHR
ncbi:MULTISPECIES: GNAT family N-acetyltransferase [unclassified Rhizobium]|uniref:GNAT family N-acetyltransferase n=1 Tax=unclassified Rhizobium TaxID=2613769 RepID=UPI0010481468|nr:MULTISPECIES: GNAT family N-acetyltransferase [unclassified Rhizobium]